MAAGFCKIIKIPLLVNFLSFSDLIDINMVGRLSLHTSQVAHQARAYAGFHGKKQLGVFLLLPGWDASPLQGYPQHFTGTHLYTWVERGTMGVKCLDQEHNTMFPARTPTWTIRSGVKHTNHEATTINMWEAGSINGNTVTCDDCWWIIVFIARSILRERPENVREFASSKFDCKPMREMQFWTSWWTVFLSLSSNVGHDALWNQVMLN